MGYDHQDNLRYLARTGVKMSSLCASFVYCLACFSHDTFAERGSGVMRHSTRGSRRSCSIPILYYNFLTLRLRNVGAGIYEQSVSHGKLLVSQTTNKEKLRPLLGIEHRTL